MSFKKVTSKFVLIAIASVTIFLFTSSCAKNKTNSKDKNTINVGAILPLTGNASYIGNALRKGMNVAIDEINTLYEQKQKPYRINLKIENSLSDPKQAILSYKKLRSEHQNIFISALSSVTWALVPLIKEDSTLLIATVVSSKGLPEQGDNIFRFFTNANIDASLMAKFAFQHLNLRRAAIIYIQDKFGIDYSDVFTHTFESLGGKIVAKESFNFNTTDFRASLLRIKNKKPDCIYIIAYSNSMTLIPRQIHETGIKATILGVGTIAQKFVLKQAGKYLKGAYYVTNAFNTYDPQNDVLRNFIEKFKKKYNTPPEYFEVFGYDIIRLIEEAATLGNGTSTRDIQSGLLKIKNFDGAVGKITVSPNGEINFPVVVGRIMPDLSLKIVYDPSKKEQ